MNQEHDLQIKLKYFASKGLLLDSKYQTITFEQYCSQNKGFNSFFVKDAGTVIPIQKIKQFNCFSARAPKTV